MKTIVWVMSMGFAVIVGCMIYLTKSGVSLRAAPYIRPSVISDDFQNVPKGMFTRLFPELQKNHYILWGIAPESPEVQITLNIFKARYEEEFKGPVTIIDSGLTATSEQIKNCPKPCWIIFPPDQANELEKNPWIEENIQPLDREYITMTWINFTPQFEVPDACHQQQRLHMDCIQSVSVRDVERKFKEEDKRYFFLRKYQDHDFFLFIEEPKTEPKTK